MKIHNLTLKQKDKLLQNIIKNGVKLLQKKKKLLNNLFFKNFLILI